MTPSPDTELFDETEVSLCNSCGCMTHTVDNRCGKCGATRDKDTNVPISPTENTEEGRKLELKLIELFSKCTSFGYSFSHSTSKEEFARMLSDGDSIDHQEAAHEAMKLITAYADQAVQAFGEKVLKEKRLVAVGSGANVTAPKEYIYAVPVSVITSLLKGGVK